MGRPCGDEYHTRDGRGDGDGGYSYDITPRDHPYRNEDGTKRVERNRVEEEEHLVRTIMDVTAVDDGGAGNWLASYCLGEWVLMRWKERGFVFGGGASQGRQQGDTTNNTIAGTGGLTIGGFYYISMNRLDGRIEGLYFDERSSPFQFLRMMPGSGGRERKKDKGAGVREGETTGAMDRMGGGWPDYGLR